MLPHHHLGKLRLGFGWCYFVGHTYFLIIPTISSIHKLVACNHTNLTCFVQSLKVFKYRTTIIHTHTHARTHTHTHARTHARTHAHTHTHTQKQSLQLPSRQSCWPNETLGCLGTSQALRTSTGKSSWRRVSTLQVGAVPCPWVVPEVPPGPPH